MGLCRWVPYRTSVPACLASKYLAHLLPTRYCTCVGPNLTHHLDANMQRDRLGVRGSRWKVNRRRHWWRSDGGHDRFARGATGALHDDCRHSTASRQTLSRCDMETGVGQLASGHDAEMGCPVLPVVDAMGEKPRTAMAIPWLARGGKIGVPPYLFVFPRTRIGDERPRRDVHRHCNLPGHSSTPM